MNTWSAYAGIVTTVVILAGAPAQAGWFSDDTPSTPTASSQTLDQIRQAFEDQRYVDAGQLLDRALMISGTDPQLLYWAAELNLARGRYQDALNGFKALDKDSKVEAEALEGEGLTLAQLGRTEEAFAVLKSSVAKNSAAWRAWNALGSQYDRRHDWGNAEDAYGRALAASGSAAIVLNNRGFSRLSQHHLDDAISDFVAALEKKPDFTAARNNLRLAIAMKGDYNKAVSGASSTDRALVLNNAGYAAMLRGDYTMAKDLFGQAMKAKGEYYAIAAANLETAQNLARGRDDSKEQEHASH